MKTLTRAGGLLLATMLLLSSCAKDSQTANMRIKLMTTNTGNTQPVMEKDLSTLTAVNLDIRQVEMHYAHPPYNWFALPCHAGIYNLLDITDDGTVVLMNDTELPQGTVTQFRWILGPDNTVTVGGHVYPLKVPSGEESGLKINLKGDIHFDHWIEVRLIFDPQHSMVEQGTGGFILTPVLEVDVINQD
jgi:hypothetical protein